MKRLYSLLIAGVLLFAACSDQPSGPDPAGNGIHKAAPTEQGTEGFDLTDRYIVVFKKDVRNTDAAIDEMTRGKVSNIHYRYHHAIKGFCATIPPQALEGIRHNPNVAYIEADGIASINTIQSVTSLRWGLDRIDQRSLPLSGSYEYLSTGSGVRVYIIDTGIRYTHTEFGGRAYLGYDVYFGDGSDWNGHGTHVAGIVGGSSVGVAKAVTLYSVRVLDSKGSGTWSGVIAGVNWVASQTYRPAVANMSLGGSPLQAVDDAVRAAVGTGITFVLAAGNENDDALNHTPARVSEAITVGSTTSTDARSSFSNYGTVLDVFAPGSSIYSSYKTSNTSYATMSGTSMASPCVAGVAALYLQNNTGASPAAVSTAITSSATTGVVTNPGTGSPNRLVYSLLSGSPTPTPPAAPSNLTATVQSATSVLLNWSDNSSDETGFVVEYSTSGTFTTIVNTISVGSNVTSQAVSGLTTNTTYYFRVRAVNAVGASANSNTVSATPMVPVQIQAHVESATAGKYSVKNNWFATLQVVIKDGFGAVVPNATVTLSWSGGASGTFSASTNSSGQVTLSTSSLNKNVAYVDLSVTNITGTNIIYAPGSNIVSFPITVTK